MCDGCGRGCNEFAVRVQNHHVRFSIDILSMVSASKWPFIFLEIVKAAAGLDTLRCRLRKDAIVGACHCTSDGQEHKIIWRAGPERERIFHLRVTACREQGSHCCHERLASRYGGRGLRAPAHSSRKSWERTTTEQTTFILWLINSPCALDRK